MPAGDTTDTLLAKLRAILDEATAGFWTDAELLYFLNMGQNEAIQILLGKQREMRRLDPAYSHPSLVNSILKTYAISTSTASSYTLPTDFLQMELVRLGDTVTTTRFLTATEVPYQTLIKGSINTYIQHSYNSSTYTGQIYYSIIGATLQTSFTTFPNGDFNKIDIWYFYQPAVMTTDVDPVLKNETHEAILNIACGYAHSKNNDLNRSQLHFGKAQILLSQL